MPRSPRLGQRFGQRFGQRLGLCLGAALVLVSACGSDDTANPSAAVTTAAATNPSAAPTTAAPTTTPMAPTTTVAELSALDSAIAEAIDLGLVLAEARTTCFEANDPTCFLAADADLDAAQEAAIQALVAMNEAATAEGLPTQDCATSIDFARRNLAKERELLDARVASVLSMDSTPGDGEWNYFSGMVAERMAPAGHEVAIALLSCIRTMRTTDTPQILDNVENVVFNAEVRARPSISYNLWTIFVCLDKAPIDGVTCFESRENSFPLASHVEELGYSIDALFEDPAYADLPESCRSAIEQADMNLNSAYAAFLEMSTKELVSSDIALLEQLQQATAQIEDTLRLSMDSIYPLDEVTVLECVEALADTTT